MNKTYVNLSGLKYFMNFLSATRCWHLLLRLLVFYWLTLSKKRLAINKEQQKEMEYCISLILHAHTRVREVPGKDSAPVDFTTHPTDKARAYGCAFLSLLTHKMHPMLPYDTDPPIHHGGEAPVSSGQTGNSWHGACEWCSHDAYWSLFAPGLAHRVRVSAYP